MNQRLRHVDTTNSPSHTIVDWIASDDIPENAPIIGGMGGWVDGEDWHTFSAQLKKGELPYYNALKTYIKANDLWNGGFWHESEGCPVFEDGTVISCSYRAWGDIMAAVHNSIERSHPYSYYDFAWEDGSPHLRRRKKKDTTSKKLPAPRLKKVIDRSCQHCSWVMTAHPYCLMKLFSQYDDAQEKGWCPCP